VFPTSPGEVRRPSPPLEVMGRQKGRRHPVMGQDHRGTRTTGATPAAGYEVGGQALTTLLALAPDVRGSHRGWKCSVRPRTCWYSAVPGDPQAGEANRPSVCCQTPALGSKKGKKKRGGRRPIRSNPRKLADWLERFRHRIRVNIVAAACGPRPEHLAGVVARVGGKESPGRGGPSGRTGSLQACSRLGPEPGPAAAYHRRGGGNQTPTTIAESSKQCLEKGGMARAGPHGPGGQEGGAAKGAHVIDVCTAYVGRDGGPAMTEGAAAVQKRRHHKAAP